MFERIVEFIPAYDKVAEGYGIHGVDLRMYLKGPDGAVQFALSTNWHLPEVTKRLMRRHYDAIGGDPHWMERPMPTDLGYHSLVPRYEGQGKMSDQCHVTGGVCYYDGSSLNAERIYEVLLREGSDGVWRELEAYYRQVFTPEQETVQS